MRVVHTPDALKNVLRKENGTVGFVPTMGALHSGHRKLIEAAKRENDIVVVSIFVNPTQFLEGEDLDKYPRREEADRRVCELSGVDYLFYPDATAMYGEDEVRLSAPDVRGYILEGTSRPGHFSGVLTVVMKLINIVNPTRAYFGKKDAQQLMLIQEMVRQLFMDVIIVPMSTVREEDGLALSSRNVYLSAQEREEALKISRSLKRAAKMVGQGITDVAEIEAIMSGILQPLEVEHIAIVDRRFKPLQYVEAGNTIILVEAVAGKTRLLDNIWI
ncbi:MAG: pantoate--beta-alanine ligase [Campylobacterota bacterium]|nr:pantoate--beta-alanine ligase [Campylobacterota bacterium]